MTYKETLFFIGKCLTISHEMENRNAIEKILKSETVDWDAVVKVSTAHYVFPALYVKLHRSNFLPYVPEDLVEYMQHITNLNRERNEQIIAQAKELNTLLLANGICPIFLKGTGNLLEGLYVDIGERMVGDIDFIVEKEDYPKAIALLTDFGYEPVLKYDYYFPSFKHYTRIQKTGFIAAVEIHKELLIEKFANEFNYEFIKNHTQQFGEISVMSYNHQLCLTIIAKQINDDGRFYKDIALRNAYDVFLLSKKTAVTEAFKGLQKLNEPLLNYTALCFEVLGKPDSLKYHKTATTKQYVADFYQLLENEDLRVEFHKKIKRKLFIQFRLEILYKSVFNKTYRSWFFKRISDKNWQKEKLIQLKLIKS